MVNFVTKIVIGCQSLNIRLQIDNEFCQLRLYRNLETFLNNVITVLIRKQIEIVVLFIHNMLNHFLIHFSSVMFQTLFNYVAAELLLRELDDITHQLSADDDVNLFDFHF